MARRMGKCTNFGNCTYADNNTEIPITELPSQCPGCGQEIHEMPEPRKPIPIKAVWGGGVALGAIAIVIWFLFLRGVSDQDLNDARQVKESILALQQRGIALTKQVEELSQAAERGSTRTTALADQLETLDQGGLALKRQAEEFNGRWAATLGRVTALQQQAASLWQGTNQFAGQDDKTAYLSRERLAQISHLKAAADTLSGDLTKIEGRAKSMLAKLEAVGNAASALSVDAQAQRDGIDQIRARGQKVTSHSRKQKEIAIGFESEANDLAERANRLIAAGKAKQVKRAAFKEELQVCQHQRESLTSKFSELEASLQELSTNTNDGKTNWRQTEQQTQKLVQQQSDLKNQLYKISEQYSHLDTQLSELENNNKGFQDKLNSFKHLLGEIASGIPECLISKPKWLKTMLPMSLVAKVEGERVPNYLHEFIRHLRTGAVYAPSFYIMRREVQVGEFRRYVDTLTASQRAALGSDWQHDESRARHQEQRPVAAIPWWAAKGYADWLSSETNCPLTLPTYNQWVAASVRYARPEQTVLRQASGQPQSRDKVPDTVIDLLGNLREWSIDSNGPTSCLEGRRYTLGEDYKTFRALIAGEPLCGNEKLSTIGLRLVMPINMPN